MQNYGVVLSDPLWWHAVAVAAGIMIVTVAAELVIGFAFASVMHRLVFAGGLVRTSILVPYGIITVASAYAWQFAFANSSGFIAGWFHLGAAFDPFGGFWSSMLVICLAEIWKTTPLVSLLLLAGLTQVSTGMLEAATVDGANAWQRFCKITLPAMKAVIVVAVVFRALGAFGIFDNIFIVTGGANGTASPSILVYDATIRRVELGLGSAMSVLLFLFAFVIASALITVFRLDPRRATSARGATCASPRGARGE